MKVPKVHRFVGIALGGGKTDRTCISVIEYYPVQRKIFLKSLHDKIRTEGEVSADRQILRLVAELPTLPENISLDAPLNLPRCFTCTHKCDYEVCDQPELVWMREHFRKVAKKKKPARLFTPYTERCVERYLQTELEEPFHLPHALGANLAPMTARAQYLSRRLTAPLIEVFPKLSLWRLGHHLNLPKSHLRFHRHWEGGATSRQFILSKLMDRNLAFIYEQDTKCLIDSPQAFDSFLCALTGLLSFLELCEPRPRGFPRRAGWIAFPRKVFAWP